MNNYKVIGVMSGTSLDGLDLAYCHFTNEQNKWDYKILKAVTIEYTEERKKQLNKVMLGSALEITAADAELGTFIGTEIKKMVTKNSLVVDFISSHGHTIFHQPSKGFTLQIGSGAHICAATKLPVVCDFRTLDVALGGQGAPLVPIGDKLLFNSSEYCLNLGGIANISFDQAGNRIAFDICPVNIVLNQLAQQLGKPYDENGEMAASGKVNADLLQQLNSMDYYKAKFPKSIGREWVDQAVFPLMQKFNSGAEDKLATFCQHVAEQIANILLRSGGAMLITGGGAFNNFLVEKIKAVCSGKVKVVVPGTDIIMFKEALIFAFLGVLRMRGEVNCLSSVTGANRDNVGGAVYFI
ncbi:MAG TPA: anhydro-N-acetylmuramic acid kinase [Cytophagaceae bacterium]|jgi:anhydro-N-acetylmuramic acid kinase|nr:anhydro-N-acetylmuramic acid kinase [Cytophagaceae bacterium]